MHSIIARFTCTSLGIRKIWYLRCIRSEVHDSGKKLLHDTYMIQNQTNTELVHGRKKSGCTYHFQPLLVGVQPDSRIYYVTRLRTHAHIWRNSISLLASNFLCSLGLWGIRKIWCLISEAMYVSDQKCWVT